MAIVTNNPIDHPDKVGSENQAQGNLAKTKNMARQSKQAVGATGKKGLKTAGRDMAGRRARDISKMRGDRGERGVDALAKRGLSPDKMPRVSADKTAARLQAMKKIKAAAAALKSPRASIKKAQAAAQAVTNKWSKNFLRLSWTNLITSFGATLVYIIFHFICRYLAASRYFCYFGEEWVPDGMGKEMDTEQKIFELFDIIALFLTVAVIGAFLLIIFVMLCIIIFSITHPGEAIMGFFS